MEIVTPFTVPFLRHHLPRWWPRLKSIRQRVSLSERCSHNQKGEEEQVPTVNSGNDVANYRTGYTKFQLKVGSSVREDVDRIKAVGSVLKNDEILMADANTGGSTIGE